MFIINLHQNDLYEVGNEWVSVSGGPTLPQSLFLISQSSHVVIVSPPLGVKLVERDMNSPFPRVNRPVLRVNSQHGEQVSHIFSYFAPYTNFDVISTG